MKGGEMEKFKCNTDMDEETERTLTTRVDTKKKEWIKNMEEIREEDKAAETRCMP